MPLLQIGKTKQSFSVLGPRIYLSVSGEGYGHSSRALAIASQFNADEILIGTYGYALDRVKLFGYKCLAVPQEFKFVGEQGSFNVSKTILQNPTRALSFNQIIQEEMAIIRNYDITLVVADGRMASVLAAARLNVPCVVVTNQSAFYPFFARDSALVKLFGRSFEWVMKLWLSSAEEILIPDFPPPNTICLPNLSDNFQVKKRTRFVGPLVPWKAEDITAYSPPLETTHSAPKRIVVSLGGHEYRRPLFDTVLQAARHFPEVHFDILTSFESWQVPTNVTLHGFVKDCGPFFKSADLVITQAGHSTAMELLTLGKPCVVVPDCMQIEQENNALRMEELGVACKIVYDSLHEQLLADTIGHMLQSPGFLQRAKEFAEQAAQLHGAAQAASVLRDYASRLLAY